MMISGRTWNLNYFTIILIKEKFKFALKKFTTLVRQILWLAGARGDVLRIKIVLIVLLNGGDLMIVADVGVNESIVRNYCSTTGCSVIECKYVPTWMDAGEEASRFIATNFKTLCPDVTSIQMLTFHNCNFCGNKLGPYWLRSDLPVDEICFRDTFLREISDDAFIQEIFFNLRSLSIMDSNVSTLKRTIFRRLGNLRTFLVQDNLVKYAESNLLKHVATTLEVLELDRSINDLAVLNNITGKGSLINVQILSIRGNSFQTLTSDTLQGVSNVQSLYMDNSEISSMAVDVFKPTRSIYQLFLTNNKLTTLPEGILDPILSRRKTKFILAINNNPWHCNCSIAWLKRTLTFNSLITTDNPICSGPETVAYQEIKLATLCTPDFNSSSPPPPTTITPDSETVNVSCHNLIPTLKYHFSRKLLAPDYQFRGKIPDFSVQEIHNGSILVRLENTSNSLTILWFENLLDSYEEEELVHCLKNVRGSLVIDDVQRGLTYTICVLESTEPTPSPLNCLALTTTPEYGSQSWLSNGDKSMTIAMVTLVLVFLCVCSGLAVFLLIRRHPHLLRGSKRVIIVRRREINAVVLPEGIRMSACPDSHSESADYISPLGSYTDKRKDSQMSRTSSENSDTSYVSGIEPSLLQLISWRNSRAKPDVPPPLPPHPRRLPSISKTVDSRMNRTDLESEAGGIAKL